MRTSKHSKEITLCAGLITSISPQIGTVASAALHLQGATLERRLSSHPRCGTHRPSQREKSPRKRAHMAQHRGISLRGNPNHLHFSQHQSHLSRLAEVRSLPLVGSSLQHFATSPQRTLGLLAVHRTRQGGWYQGQLRRFELFQW